MEGGSRGGVSLRVSYIDFGDNAFKVEDRASLGGHPCPL